MTRLRNAEERLKLITRNTIEVVTLQDLRSKLESGERLRGYIGYEPSGIIHIGWLVWMQKVKDLIEAGVEFIILEATWHAMINDKLGGNIQLIRESTQLVKATLEAIGVPIDKVKFIDAENLVSDTRYWEILIRVAKKNTLHRVKRALTIMGRKSEEAEIDSSKIIYPLMQVSDIFYLDLDIALGGLDQRKAHMLARDSAEKLGFKKPIALHTPILTGLAGLGRMDIKETERDEVMAQVKMSKSKPQQTIYIHYKPDTIKYLIGKAYCPKGVIEFNPILEINKYILFNDKNFQLVVRRPIKYGGTVVYERYEDLERDFASGKLHPADLKNATAEALIEYLKPIREKLLSDEKNVEILRKLEPFHNIPYNYAWD